MDTAHPGGGPSRGGYEKRDLSVQVIGTSLLGLALSVVIVLLLMWWVFEYLAARQARMDVPPSPLAPARQLPPEPRLQVAPRQSLKAMQAEEDAALTSYGWVDQKAGTARIPIDRAMELLTQRGLPTRSQSQTGGTR